MKKETLVCILILFSGCISQGPVCNKPYIQVGNDCCLDSVGNGICDKDRPIATTVPSTIKTTTSTTTTSTITLPQITTPSIQRQPEVVILKDEYFRTVVYDSGSQLNGVQTFEVYDNDTSLSFGPNNEYILKASLEYNGPAYTITIYCDRKENFDTSLGGYSQTFLPGSKQPLGAVCNNPKVQVNVVNIKIWESHYKISYYWFYKTD